MVVKQFLDSSQNKSENNNYNVITLSYNLNELVGSATTQILGLSTSIGAGSSTSALVHIGAATTLGGSSQGAVRYVATVGTASTTG